MLRRRKIRTKLFLSLGLLTSIVLLLAFSGFWGLYRYKRLAKSVNQAAYEIKNANELNWLANALKESNARITQYRNHGGMIDSGLLTNRFIEHEQAQYNETLDTLKRHLQMYQHAVSEIETHSDPLIGSSDHRRSLAAIETAVNDLDSFRRNPDAFDYSRSEEMLERLSLIHRLTQAHLQLIEGRMTDFSRNVGGQYRAWIGIAWFSAIVSLIMVALLVWSFHSLVVKPFQTLLDGSRLVAKGQTNHIIDLGTDDELSELAVAMNGMTKRFQNTYAKLNAVCSDLDRQVQQRTREVIQNEQLASVGFLAAGVAHEINNPLATIAWSAESLESRIEEAVCFGGESIALDDELLTTTRSNLRRIQEEAFRCKGITERLLDFSRLGEVRRSSTNLTELVEEIVSMVSKVGKFRCKSLRTHASGPVFAHVNPQEIRQVILNLITNALESVSTDGAVDVHVDGDNDGAKVTVMDNGCGMSADVLKHLFEPFFTRRRDGTGTGLGLSITYRIVSQHGGSLIPQSDGEGCGSRMQLLLPAVSENEDQSTSNRHSMGWNHESIKAA
ncbi:sensor histidine kinase [Novipirellula artificiosorum]|uniref:histidine kinase n=1 Tax=Novipirellula artificiosorum TaxID=2528016 RepID=A0A5C6DB56_9BACT|nr:sensor histidine kinase [Novipirellula artificiosorum]TWU32971.1 Sensor protein ZraS [Novipirellula artificiosorum]